MMGYLIKPVQKICKYPLLMKELLRYTPAEHPDHDSIEIITENPLRFLRKRPMGRFLKRRNGFSVLISK